MTDCVRTEEEREKMMWRYEGEGKWRLGSSLMLNQCYFLL